MSIALDHLMTDAVGDFTLDGVTHDILPLNAGEYQRLTNGVPLTLTECFAIVRRIVPTLSDEAFARVTGPVAGAILAIADGQVKAVEDMLPNSSGPTSTETSGPASPTG